MSRWKATGSLPTVPILNHLKIPPDYIFMDLRRSSSIWFVSDDDTDRMMDWFISLWSHLTWWNSNIWGTHSVMAPHMHCSLLTVRNCPRSRLKVSHPQPWIFSVKRTLAPQKLLRESFLFTIPPSPRYTMVTIYFSVLAWDSKKTQK